MMLIDANILFYAEDSLSRQHEEARTWWEQTLSGEEPVALAWITCLAYIRVFTNPRAVRYPLPLSEVTATIDRWFDRPVVRMIGPSRRFWGLFQKLLVETQSIANLSSDAYLAALAIENDCLLCSTDNDFSRFPGLRWWNPLKG